MRCILWSNDFLKPNSRSWFESIGTLTILFLQCCWFCTWFVQGNLWEKTICWNCIRFCQKFWTMSKYKWPLGVKVFCFYVLSVKNFRFHWKSLMVQQNWIPTVQGIAMRKKLVSELPKILDWLFVSGGIFCRFFKTAFIVSEQSFWRKIYFSKKSTFFHRFWILGENFRHLAGRKWLGHQNCFFSWPVVSYEGVFIFCIDVFPINFVLLAENLRQDFQKWFLRNFGGALTKTSFRKNYICPISLGFKHKNWCLL